jgi:hypothetical protein
MKTIGTTMIATAGVVLAAVLAAGPSAAQDAAGKPAATKPATAAAVKPVKPKPAAAKPATAKPAAAKPAQAKPAAAKPAAAKPAAAKSAAVKSATAKAAAPAAAPAAGSLAVTVAPAIVPAADLLATAKRLRDAAAAKDGEAVAALIADEVTVVTMSIDLGSAPQVTKEGPYTAAADLLAVVGRAAGVGDVAPGTPKAKIDERLQASAFDHIVASVDHADWGRDPRVKGGFCTHRGRTWNATAVKAAAKAGGAVEGGTVAKPIPARASAAAKAAVVATLAHGRLHLVASGTDAPAGWRAVRLATGKIGFVESAALTPPTTSGICFLPNVDGGWLMSAVSGVGL